MQSDEVKALRARLDRMQNKLAEAKRDIADGKDQRQKIRDKKLQGIQDQTAALKRDREEIAKITAEVSRPALSLVKSLLSTDSLILYSCR